MRIGNRTKTELIKRNYKIVYGFSVVGRGI